MKTQKDLIGVMIKIVFLTTSTLFCFFMTKWLYNASEAFSHLKDLKPIMVCIVFVSIFVFIHSIFTVVNKKLLHGLFISGYFIACIIVALSTIIGSTTLIYIIGGIFIILEIISFIWAIITPGFLKNL